MRCRLIAFRLILAIALMFPALEAIAADTDKFSLTDAVRQALYTSPEYDIATNQRNAERERYLQAQALYLPSLDLQAQAGREKVTSPNISRDDAMWQRNGSLTLTQLLFDGGNSLNEIESRKYRTESATRRVNEVSEFLGLDVVQAYLDILRQRSLLKIAQSNLDNHHGLFGKIRAGAEAGTNTRGDASQAEARLINAKADLVTIEQDLRDAEAIFIQKVGDMPGELAFPQVPRNALPGTVEDAIQAAMAGSPTLAVYQSDIKSAEADREGTAGAFFPRVALEVRGSDGRNIGGVAGNEHSVAALAVMRWNLFRGGADVARKREFSHREAEIKSRAAFAMRQVERDVRQTWAARQSAETRAMEFRLQSKADKRVVLAYMDQFTLNRRTLLDVLNAQNELFLSRTNYINALYAEAFAVYRLLALQGKMLPVLGIMPPAGKQKES